MCFITVCKRDHGNNDTSTMNKVTISYNNLNDSKNKKNPFRRWHLHRDKAC